jgi:hypothetical protein
MTVPLERSLQELPMCPRHGKTMALADRTHMSEMMRWQGAWYDCQEPGCSCSAVLTSTELEEFLKNMTKKVI